MKNNTELWVNIDHIATLRQARNTPYPDIATAINSAEQVGVCGITMHLREDRRHVQDADIILARQIINSKFNFEMAATDEMVEIACQVIPDECCIVPEKREELTTEGGLDVQSQARHIQKQCQKLKSAGIRVSLFIEPQIKSIDQALEVGADIVELHTGQYALAPQAQKNKLCDQIAQIAEYGFAQGLQVNAGHGLHRGNVKAIAMIPQIKALNIGHAIIADAVLMGLKDAIIAMDEAMR